jgi:hypothetical protein
VGDEIPTLEDGQPRAIAAIMNDVNRAFEIATRRDPANWFWVHNRWKPRRAGTGRAPGRGPQVEQEKAERAEESSQQPVISNQ